MGAWRDHRGGGNGKPPVVTDEVDAAAFGLQARHIGMERPPVDAFDFQRDVMTDKLGNVMRCHADGLRWLLLTDKVRSLRELTPAWLPYHTGTAESANNTTPRRSEAEPH